MSKRDEKAWDIIQEQACRQRGVLPLRFLECRQCGQPVACPLTSDPPANCSEHN